MELQIVVNGLDSKWLEYEKFDSTASSSKKKPLYFGLIGGIEELSAWGLSDVGSVPMQASGEGTYMANYIIYHPLSTEDPLELRVLVLEKKDSGRKDLTAAYRRVAVECGTTLPRQANVMPVPGGYRVVLDMTGISNTTFGSIRTYFPSLDALSHSNMVNAAPGPLLSLHFYGNNPRLPYSQTEWRAASSALLGDQAPQDSTTFLEVCELRRVPAPGSQWKNVVPKPYQSHASKSNCVQLISSPTKLIRSERTNTGENDDDDAWCVKALQRSVPVKDEGLHSFVTQDYWISTVNLEHMENHLLEVEIRLPLKKEGSQECMFTYGSTILASSMLGQGTNGTIDIPVKCVSEGSEQPLWVVLHIQYTLHYLRARGNDFRFLRSKQSYEAVTSKRPVGHRGLGKTFTIRGSPQKTRGVKLAENSIDAFNVAHQRGCEMVEFDVMLTHDAVPIIFHDPVVELLAKAAPSIITQTTKAQNLVPTSVPVHHLTEKKLQWVLKQSRNLGIQSSCKLKSMLLRYWSDIVALGREATSSGGKSCSCPTTTKPISSLMSQRIDITHAVPTLKDMFLHTPPSLRFNIEVKYPFQPIWDENMFMQKDVFEINRFVDAILNVVFEYAEDNRTIAFSSFEPDVCVALATKQSRYNVLFLSDTSEREDLKDYRTYYVEGAIQFASAHKLSGISICSSTLLEDKECKNYGKLVVEAAHCRGLKVWTWGETNMDPNFFHEQINNLGVDGVITDNVAHNAA